MLGLNLSIRMSPRLSHVSNIHTRQEIASLESKVSTAKERYQETIYSAKESQGTLSALPAFDVNDKFVLNQDEAWYTLSIEIQVPLETVVLQVYPFILTYASTEGHVRLLQALTVEMQAVTSFN